MEIRVGDKVLRLVQGDITSQQVDAIVNAANSGLMGGGGVDGAIHRAGGPAILEGCTAIVAERGRLPPGQAVITKGGRLLADYVIHTVGPVWSGGGRGEAETLASAYGESLALASGHGLRSIAFPSISTGAFGYPLAEASEVAIESILTFLKEGHTSVDQVSLVLFNAATMAAYEGAMDALMGPRS